MSEEKGVSIIGPATVCSCICIHIRVVLVGVVVGFGPVQERASHPPLHDFPKTVRGQLLPSVIPANCFTVCICSLFLQTVPGRLFRCTVKN